MRVVQPAEKLRGKKKHALGVKYDDRYEGIVSSKEHQALMAQREIGSLGNPCFSYARCPRYHRLHSKANAREHARLAAELEKAAEGGAKLSKASWKKKAASELAKWEQDSKEEEATNNLWALVVHADEVRPLEPAECKRDGYVHGLQIINDRKCLTVVRQN